MKTKIGILVFLSLIIIFPTYAIEGAKSGLVLWFQTVLPTLLPFIIVSNLIIRLNLTKPLSSFLYPLFRMLLGISKNGCYPVLIGFLSGIPVGAKSVNDLYLKKEITKEEGNYLLGICNNASPMFIMSYIAISQLNQPQLRFLILGILYLASILSVRIHFSIKKSLVEKNRRQKHLHAMAFEDTEEIFDFGLLDTSIMNGFEIITRVGGYIILFSIPASVLIHILPDTFILKYLMVGLLEITIGINQINLSSLSEHTKIILTIAVTAFGGFSGLAQTKSVINESRLSLKSYFVSKLINVALATVMITMYLSFIGTS